MFGSDFVRGCCMQSPDGQPDTGERLRIGILSPVVLPVPPVGYAGTERVIATLVEELHGRGHRVTLFGAGDSQVPCELEAVVDTSLWASGYMESGRDYLDLVVAAAWDRANEFDILHSHLEGAAFLLARHGPTPLVTTFHGRLDEPGMPERLAAFPEIPLISISDSQRRWAPDANWIATIHHGLLRPETPFSPSPGSYLLFVGRVAPEKGVGDAIELARSAGLPLKVAAKVREPIEEQLFAELVQPAIDDGVVEFLGELDPTARDAVLAGALATIMLGSWPEPFGLVAIESMATGTPVIARRAGALTETVSHGTTGFLVDDLTEAALAVRQVAELDRLEIRRAALDRFSPQRMVDAYEGVYHRVIAEGASGVRLDPAAAASAS
jgi:glycosyltransferase involved in cell wall biosynthesis